MHCASCGYDLTGLPPGPCPECSRPFSPEDPSTWVERFVPPWRRTLLSRWSGYVAIALVIFLAMKLTILPRPYTAWNGTMDPMLWIWFDQPFGVERRPAFPERLDLSWWNGTLTGARLLRADPTTASTTRTIAWDIRRRGERWDLEVLQPDVPLDSVLVAYNSMRRDDELFGLELDEPRDADGNRISRFDVHNDGPFHVTGRQEDVLAAILVAYDLKVRPLLVSADDTDLWVFDPDAKRLEHISVDEADARGIEYTRAREFAVRRHHFQ